MWYKALIAFMLNSGGFRSAKEKGQREKVRGGKWEEKTGMEIRRFQLPNLLAA